MSAHYRASDSVWPFGARVVEGNTLASRMVAQKQDRAQSELETNHVAQWKELEARGRTFDLNMHVTIGGFILMGPPGLVGEFERRTQIGTYLTLADLRAGISDWVAAQRAAGARF